MGLRQFLKATFSSGRNNKSEFEKSLPHRLRGAASDIKFKIFRAAEEQLLSILNHRNQMTVPGPIKIALQYLGAVWYLQDEYQKGIEFFSDYIRQYPGDADAYSQRAMMFWYSDKQQEAVEDFSRTLEMLPGDYFALSGRGQALVELGQRQEALRDLDQASKAVDQYPTLDLSWSRRNQAYIQSARAAALADVGEFDLALRDFEVSIALCPDNAWSYYRRARAYETWNERAKAISEYQTALYKTDPRLPLSKARYAEARIQALRDVTSN
jgi:tetratricopeptide (TPR) repeat protein